MITETIRPDVAIVTDVTHDTHTPMINKIKTRYGIFQNPPMLF